MRANPSRSSEASVLCGCAHRLSVTACFDRGRQRQRLPELANVGRWIEGREQVGARFSVELTDGILSDIRFRATTCITLVAYCDLLSERCLGLTPVAALNQNAQQLVSALPGVPPGKQDRASVTVTSLHSAIAATINTKTVETS